MSANNRKNEPARANASAINANTQGAAGTTLTLAVELAPPASVAARLSAIGASAEQCAATAELAERIVGHVVRAVDRDALFRVEQCVWSELGRLRIPDDEGDLATALLAEALFQVAYWPERNIVTIPAEISSDEVIAAEYDDECIMCRAEVADMKYRRSGQRCEDLAREAEDKEWVAMQRQAAEDWRAENIEALRRFELA